MTAQLRVVDDPAEDDRTARDLAVESTGICGRRAALDALYVGQPGYAYYLLMRCFIAQARLDGCLEVGSHG